MHSHLRLYCVMRFGVVFAVALTMYVVRGAGKEWTLDGDKQQRIDALFGQWNKANSPGAAIGVAKQGELVYSRGYGSANLDHAIPIRPDSVFYIASTSKQFAAAGIALLSLDGIVELDDDIRKWLPEFTSITDPITIRHLIHHTSGIRDYGLLRQMRGGTFNEYFENEDTVALLARQKTGNFIPGSQFRYCNSNYVLLAEVLKRASGMTCQAYTEKHIFAPLGMDSTRWGLAPSRVLANRVTSYLRLGGSPDLLRFDVNFGGHGDGNLWTTVEDLARWDGNFYKPKVGGQELLKLIATRGRLQNGTPLDYAFGLSHGQHNGLPTVSHAGQLFGYCSEVMRFPEQGLCVIVLANLGSIDTSAKAKQIADIVLDLEKDPPVRDVPQKPRRKSPDNAVAPYVGEFYQADCGRVLQVTTDTGWLMLHGLRQPLQLRETGSEQFGALTRDTKVTFERRDGLPARALLLELSTAADPIRLERVIRRQVDAAALVDFTGRYRSDELQTDWILRVTNRKLSVRLGRQLIPFDPLDRDRFESDVFDVAFRRDESNRIVGLTVFSEGASGISFDRVAP